MLAKRDWPTRNPSLIRRQITPVTRFHHVLTDTRITMCEDHGASTTTQLSPHRGLPHGRRAIPHRLDEQGGRPQDDRCAATCPRAVRYRRARPTATVSLQRTTRARRYVRRVCCFNPPPPRTP